MRMTHDKAIAHLNKTIDKVKSKFQLSSESPSGIIYKHTGRPAGTSYPAYTVTVCNQTLTSANIMMLLVDDAEYKKLRLSQLTGAPIGSLRMTDDTLEQPYVPSNFKVVLSGVQQVVQESPVKSTSDDTKYLQKLSKSQLKTHLGRLGIDVEVLGFNDNHPMMK